MFRRILTTAAFALVACAALAPNAIALAPGDNVPGFQTLDRKLIPTSIDVNVNAVAEQPDGKLVATFGKFSEGLGFTRLNADGSLDTSFASAGIFIQNTALYVVAKDIAIDPQGRIVFAGDEENDGGDPGRIVVGRLTPAGALDPTFGTGGMVRYLPASTTNARVSNVFLAPDGSINVAGHMNVSGDDDLFAAKVTSAGVFDTTYSVDGVTSVGSTANEYASDALRLPDGRIVVMGYRYGASNANRGAYLNVYGADGSVGPSTFEVGVGTDDEGDPDPWTFTTGVVLGPSTIRIAQHRPATPYPNVSTRMAQYTVTGNAATLDVTYDGDGYGPDLTLQMHPTDMLRAGDDKLVLIGYDDRNAYGLHVTRLNAPGTAIDTTFGTSGDRLFGVHDPQASYHPHVIETADGSLIVSGNHRIESPFSRNQFIAKIAGRIARVSTSVTTSVTAPKVGTQFPITVQVNAAGPDATGALTTNVTIPTNLLATAPAGCAVASATTWSCASTGATSFVFTARATAAQSDAITATTTGSVYDDDRTNDAASLTVTSSKRSITASFKQLTRTRKGKLATSTCGATSKKSCIAARIRPNVRLAALQLRAAVAPVAEQVPAKATVTVQKLVKGKWVAIKLTGKVGIVTIGKGNLGTWTLPFSLRSKAAQLRVRVNVAASTTTAAASSAWRYVRVR